MAPDPKESEVNPLNTSANPPTRCFSRIKVLSALMGGLFTASCATYKIVPEFLPSHFSPNSVLEVEQQETQFPGGVHCYEPMLFYLSAGIIPAHCVETYQVSEVSESAQVKEFQSGVVKVTLMHGWVALFLAPLPGWRYGYGYDVEDTILEEVNRARN